MFIYNVKVNGSKLFKLFFTAIIVLVILIGISTTFLTLNILKYHDVQLEIKSKEEN